ncbi:hypothetical protein, partial [Synechococcus sp. HBA1120]
FTFLLVQTFLVNTIPAVFLDENSQREDGDNLSKTFLFYKATMINSITNLNENLEIYIESGTGRLRSKEEVSFELLPKEKLKEHNILIPEKAD